MPSSSRCPMWARDNPDQQTIVSKSKTYSKIIIRNTADFCETVIMAGLWMYLITLEVINHQVKAELQSHPTNSDQVEALLDYLLQSSVWKLHGYFKALCMSDQAHIVSQILFLNLQDYEGDNQEDRNQATRKKQLKKELKDHHEVYRRTLMQGSLFDIPSLDMPYDMEPCYIQLLATEDGFLRNPETILPADILKPKPGKATPRTAILSGPPGAGKTSFIKFFVYKWSQQEDGSSDWDLIVILNVSTLQLTKGKSSREHIKEAIQQSLEGPGDKADIMKSLNDEDLKMLIIPDGMDEVRSPTILNMMKDLISSCHKGSLGFTVLSTCRSGLSPIMDRLFDRMMKLDGFTIHEGIEYVQQFYQEIKKPDEDSIFDYIVNSPMELDHILTNPLCTHILSVVTADGTLKLVKGRKLRMNELFDAMEKSMRRRQLEKTSEGSSNDVLTESQLEDQIKRFHHMSLWSLVQDVRTFDEKILSLFGIQPQNPYFIFLQKVKHNSFLTQVSNWQYNHEAFREYFSTCALEALPENLRSALLLFMSSDEKFRNSGRRPSSAE